MESQWQAERSALRDLLLTRPDLSLKEMAALLKRSSSWAKAWAKRLRQAPPTDQAVLCSRSRARKTPWPDWDAQVLQRIEEIRLAPPSNLRRTPGPKAILSFLRQDQELQQQECQLPQAASTIWKLLHRLGFLSTKPAREHEAEPLWEPLEEVQVDFKDANTVPPDPLGKRQHVVEICNASGCWHLPLALCPAARGLSCPDRFGGRDRVLAPVRLPSTYELRSRSALVGEPQRARFSLRTTTDAALPGHRATHLPAAPP